MPPKQRITTPASSSDNTLTPEASSTLSGTSPSKGSGGNATTQHIPLDFGILVATRIRPFNKKELAEHVKELKAENRDLSDPPAPVMDAETDGKTLVLLEPKDMSSRASFTFDYIFTPFAPTVEISSTTAPKRRNGSFLETGASSDSDEESEEIVAERAQSDVYRALGAPIVKSAWEGYNACIFAYGQTSSGKTYTMMGTKRDPGVIPRLCKELFERIEADEERQKRGLSPTVMSPMTPQDKPPVPPPAASRRMVKVTVSYMEIYNEQVRDLLKPRPKGAKPKFNVGAGDGGDEYQSLKVRQHPLHGPFVEGLTTVNVDNWLECVKIIRQGNEVRSHCTTEMNESSSRSHAIFQMILTQTEALGARVRGKDVTNHKVSKINLVDLAGSERIVRTNVSGKHLTEAQNINQSLSTLRRVIDTLVQKKKAGAAMSNVVVPYRESMLTWILSDNFGGNSKTVMCANVSPHSSNVNESESTLRYATLARGIVNRIRVNEDPSAKLIRELQTQLKSLTDEMQRGPQQFRVEELMEEINENRHAMEELSAKEEGMKRLITESRAREEQLLSDVQSHQISEERWRKEAEKLRKEKEELRRALHDIAKSNPDLFAKTKEDNFWSIDIDNASPETAPDDDSTVCPPLSRRKSSMRIKRQSTVAAVGPKRASPRAGDSVRNASTLWDLGGSGQMTTSSKPKGTPPLPPSTASVATSEPSRAPTVSPSGEVPRFGRRAATEETRERPRDSRESIRSSERPMSEQAFQQLNSRLAAGQVRQSVGSVPLSLQHLAGLTPVTTTTTNVFGSLNGARSPSLGSPASITPVAAASKAPVAPVAQPRRGTPPPAKEKETGGSGGADALDAFLEGGGTAPAKPARGVPPWRKPKK